MCFAPEEKELIISTIKKSISIQVDDFTNNNVTTQFLRVIAEYLSQRRFAH